jgi:deoxyribose-phosphate aldolase
MTKSHHQLLFSFLDLTSLNPEDSISSIEEFTQASLACVEQGFKPAAICVFPNFAYQVRALAAKHKVLTAAVAGSFPASQSFEAIKLMECKMAVNSGADEVDVVMNLGAFFDANYDRVVHEIKAMKDCVGTATLKVILETGVLQTKERIRKAAELAVLGGADFLKTSTGKVPVGATPEAVKVMCDVSMSNKRNGVPIGIKVSGGVRSVDDAQRYYEIVAEGLGSEFMTKEYFRIGASTLAKALLNE